MEVRFLTPDDTAEWLRLRLEALRGAPEAFSASLEEYESLTLDAVRRRLWSTADAFVVGACHEGRMCGMAGFFRDTGIKSRHKGHVWGVYVTPVHRRTGVAKQMMQKILDRAATIEGVEQVLLSVSVTQEAAAKLYYSLGFQSFGCEPRAIKVGDRYIDEENLILRLGNSGAPQKP